MMRLTNKNFYAVRTEGDQMTYLGTGTDVAELKEANILPEGELFVIKRAGAKIEAQTIYAIVEVGEPLVGTDKKEN